MNVTPAQRRYLGIEAIISAAINAVFSIVFVFLVFGSSARVAQGAIAWDAVPQTFMIAFMATLIPTLLTKKRIRAGTLQPRVGRRSRLPRQTVLRAIAVAVVATAVAGPLAGILLRLGPIDWPFWPVLIAKTVYGALLGAVIGAFAAYTALGNTVISAETA